MAHDDLQMPDPQVDPSPADASEAAEDSVAAPGAAAGPNVVSGVRRSRAVLPTFVAILCGIVVALLVSRWFTDTTGKRTDRPLDAARSAAVVAVRGGSGPRPGLLPAASAASAAVGARPADAEVCGMPGVTLNPDVDFDKDPRFSARIAAANKRYIDALSTNADDEVRAAGLLLRRSADLYEAGRVERAAARARCATDQACLDDADRPRPDSPAVREAVVPATDALARAAATTRSPIVYAAAFEACATSAAPACQLVSAEQWTRIDPDSVEAWLHVVETAGGRNDSGALDDAMNHVAHATGYSSYGDRLAAIADAAIPGASDDFSASQMRLTASSLLVSRSFVPLKPIRTYCAQPLLADSNRRQICDSVAHRLVDRGSYIEENTGIELGRRLGWPADTLSALQKERTALNEVQLQAFAVTDFSCRSSAELSLMMQALGNLGERGAARAALVASGKSVDDLVADWETRVSRFQAKIASEAAVSASGFAGATTK